MISKSVQMFFSSQIEDTENNNSELIKKHVMTKSFFFPLSSSGAYETFYILTLTKLRSCINDMHPAKRLKYYLYWDFGLFINFYFVANKVVKNKSPAFLANVA